MKNSGSHRLQYEKKRSIIEWVFQHSLNMFRIFPLNYACFTVYENVLKPKTIQREQTNKKNPNAFQVNFLGNILKFDCSKWLC